MNSNNIVISMYMNKQNDSFVVFCLQTDEHTAPGTTQSPLWYASQHLQDGEVISFKLHVFIYVCTAYTFMQEPITTTRI